MSDDTPPVRRGGRFTFLLAFAAFVMSATALYQINRDSEAFRALEEKMKALYADVSQNVRFDNLGPWLSDQAAEVRDALFDAKNYDRAEELLGTIGDRVAAYLEQLKGRRDAESTKLARELKRLQDSVEDAKASVASRADGAIDDVDRVREQIEALGGSLDAIGGSGSRR